MAAHAAASTTTTTTSTPHQPHTPSDPEIQSAVSSPTPPQNPFASGVASVVNSSSSASSARNLPAETQQQRQPQTRQQPTLRQRHFHSRRIKKGEQERPWLHQKDPKEKWVWIIPLVGLVLGLCVAGYLIWDGISSVTNHEYCEVLMEDWSGGIDERVWLREVEVGGFGNGQFDETTTLPENTYIDGAGLHIKPTLQDPALVTTNNATINLTATHACTSHELTACVTHTNTTNGTIVNPARSARLSTRPGARIKYGRVEVEARLPAGDWLWPAIWMLPANSTYGAWPASGEIDIMESRGNNYTFPQGGSEVMSSTLHWGPDGASDRWFMNNNKRAALHTTYTAGFHTFGLEWSERYLFTWVDSRLAQVMYVDFDEPFWKRGKFPPAEKNGSVLVDPWSQTGRVSTPFDEDFYLILNVAVGGTNGWFEDGTGGKPWVDQSPTAKKEFWEKRRQFFPTWAEGGMVVKSVKMWQQKGYNGC